MKENSYDSMGAGKVLGMTALESLPEVVKDIMKRQPLNPFVKCEVKILPLFYPGSPAGQLQGK